MQVRAQQQLNHMASCMSLQALLSNMLLAVALQEKRVLAVDD
jgi:hypothetical protein